MIEGNINNLKNYDDPFEMARSHRRFLKKIEKQYLKGRLIWDSNKYGTYIKSIHGEIR